MFPIWVNRILLQEEAVDTADDKGGQVGGQGCPDKGFLAVSFDEDRDGRGLFQL